MTARTVARVLRTTSASVDQDTVARNAKLVSSGLTVTELNSID